MDNLEFLEYLATAECTCDLSVGHVCETCLADSAAKEFRAMKDRISWISEVMNFISTYDIDDIKWSHGIEFWVSCNDVFFWGCADAEDLTPETVGVLYDAFNEVNALCDKTDIDKDSVAHNEYGAYVHDDIACLLYCAKMRKMRPQDAFYQGKYIPEWAFPLFDACGPKRKKDFFNPGKLELKGNDNESN